MSNTNVGRIKNKKIQKNNTSGCSGVSWHSRMGRWSARISFKGKTYNLGYFDRLEDAIAKRKSAEKKTFDEFLADLESKKTITI